MFNESGMFTKQLEKKMSGVHDVFENSTTPHFSYYNLGHMNKDKTLYQTLRKVSFPIFHIPGTTKAKLSVNMTILKLNQTAWVICFMTVS